ncbi:MAG: Ku domain protein [Labilithrix sp.]|nr:Ku domain protein [Labilithrix sp.]
MARTAHAKKAETSTENDDAESTAPGRGIWSGSISFGLLQIPVTLYPAERRAEEIRFRQLDKHDHSPIRYERLNSTTGKPVEWKDIVKGYEYEPENFVILEPEDLKKANVKATQTIDIQDFVPVDQIDPAFFETPYYVVPQKRAQKAYVLLREALKKKNAVAIATFVLRTREHLCALMPVGDAIMLEVLRYGHELRKPKDMQLPGRDASIGQRELAMAEQLIEGMMADWEPAKYRDRFYADVMKMIEEKAKTGTVKGKAGKMRGEVANDVVDLLDLLKKSVAAKGKNQAANDSHHKKPGPKKTARRNHKKHEAA